VNWAFRISAISSMESNSCVEKDVEVLPMEKIVTVLPEDIFGNQSDFARLYRRDNV
jgi:hypothetical protein